jgi:hypothetical protein
MVPDHHRRLMAFEQVGRQPGYEIGGRLVVLLKEQSVVRDGPLRLGA